MNNAIKIFTDYRQFQIFILGIFSGMPLAIIYTTLATWMTTIGIDIAIVTTFAIARVFYSLKFLWAPYVDQVNLPIIHRIGHRKSWMFLVSGLIAIVTFSYSQCNPVEFIIPVFVLTICLGILSATLDIFIDAYRIDLFEKDKLSIAAANAVFGYRLGLLVSGAGALYISDDYGWQLPFVIISMLYIVAMVFILTLGESQAGTRKGNFKYIVFALIPFLGVGITLYEMGVDSRSAFGNVFELATMVACILISLKFIFRQVNSLHFLVGVVLVNLLCFYLYFNPFVYVSNYFGPLYFNPFEHVLNHFGPVCIYLFCLAVIFFIFTWKGSKSGSENLDEISLDSWKSMTIVPFIDFLKRDGAIIIFLAIIFYKLGDAFLGVVAYPFYINLGFTPKEISLVAKVFGFFATISGAYLGGFIMYRFGYFKGLMIGGIAQSITNFAFVWLNHMGHDTNALAVAIAIENIASGMGDAALVGYLSYLCNKQFSATQYALLSSASGLFSHSIVMFGGKMVKEMGYDMYFTLTVVLAIPGLLLLIYLNKKYGLSNNPSVDQKTSESV